ncbi:MAG: site-2 protease family protein, partial [Nitratireductor sp.]
MSAIVIAAVIGVNLVLIFLLLAAPLGRRRLVASVSIDAGMERVWNAVWPLGPDAGWSGEFVSTEPVGENRARVRLSHEGRDGRPIERTVRLEAVRPGEGFCLRVES